MIGSTARERQDGDRARRDFQGVLRLVQRLAGRLNLDAIGDGVAKGGAALNPDVSR